MGLSPSILKPILAGLTVTAVQIALAVLVLAPDGSFSERYATLVQHDSYWFMNIINRGYQTIVPPIDHKVMEVSNVAFFPGYPLLAGAFRYGFGIATSDALLIAAQAATFGFWTYFFLFCQRWHLSPGFQIAGALTVLAHPAAFFLIAGYSESLFLMSLLGFLYWSSLPGRTATLWAGLHGMVMSATRIVGIPCALASLVYSIFKKGVGPLGRPLAWFRYHGSAMALTLISMSGAALFLFYCQARWGRWDMYLLTQSAGWGIVPDYLAVFKPSSYHWLVPSLDNPTEASQMAMTLGGLVFVLIALAEVVSAFRRETRWVERMGIYFSAAVIYYISVSGVACVGMESMLRYQFCAHALIVLALLHFLNKFSFAPVAVRAIGVAIVALGSAAGFAVEGWYLWNFTRGNWIA